MINEEEITEKHEKRFKRIRAITTALVCFPYFFIFFPSAALFFVTLFPFSLALLIIHFFLRRQRTKLKMKINEWDSLKIGLGIAGVLVGLIFWAMIGMISE